jgi:hypothetical protein
VPADSNHIGFRVADALAAPIDRACGAAPSSRSSVVHEAIRRGLTLLEADARPTISAVAAAAGRHQLRVSVTDADAARLHALQARITDSSGRPAVRAFALRECLWRGLQDVARHPPAGERLARS